MSKTTTSVLYQVVAKSQMPTLACQHCFARNDRLHHCSDCKHASYCNKQCASASKQHIGCSDTGARADYASLLDSGSLIAALQFGAGPDVRHQRAQAYLMKKKQRLTTLFSFVNHSQLLKSPNTLARLNILVLAQTKLTVFANDDFKKIMFKNRRVPELGLDDLRTYAALVSEFAEQFRLFMAEFFPLLRESDNRTNKATPLQQIRAILEELMHGVRVMQREHKTRMQVLELLSQLLHFLGDAVVTPIVQRAEVLLGWASRLLSSTTCAASKTKSLHSRTLQLSLLAFESRGHLNPMSIIDDKVEARQTKLTFFLRKLTKLVSTYVSNIDPETSLWLYRMLNGDPGLRREGFEADRDLDLIRSAVRLISGISASSLAFTDPLFAGFLCGPAAMLHIEAYQSLSPILGDLFAPNATLATARRDSEAVLTQAKLVNHSMINDLQSAQNKFDIAVEMATKSMDSRLNSARSDPNFAKHQWKALGELGKFAEDPEYELDQSMLPGVLDAPIRELALCHLLLTETMAEIEYDFLDDENRDDSSTESEPSVNSETFGAPAARRRARAGAAKPKGAAPKAAAPKGRRGRSASPRRSKKEIEMEIKVFDEELEDGIAAVQGKGRGRARKTLASARIRAERETAQAQSDEVTPETRESALTRFKQLTYDHKGKLILGGTVVIAVAGVLYLLYTGGINQMINTTVGQLTNIASRLDGISHQWELIKNGMIHITDLVKSIGVNTLARVETISDCTANGLCQVTDNVMFNLQTMNFRPEVADWAQNMLQLTGPELIDYFTTRELNPSFFVNIPDIVHPYTFPVPVVLRALALCFMVPAWKAAVAVRVAAQLAYCAANGIAVLPWTISVATQFGAAIPAGLLVLPTIVGSKTISGDLFDAVQNSSVWVADRLANVDFNTTSNDIKHNNALNATIDSQQQASKLSSMINATVEETSAALGYWDQYQRDSWSTIQDNTTSLLALTVYFASIMILLGFLRDTGNPKMYTAQQKLRDKFLFRNIPVMILLTIVIVAPPSVTAALGGVVMFGSPALTELITGVFALTSLAANAVPVWAQISVAGFGMSAMTAPDAIKYSSITLGAKDAVVWSGSALVNLISRLFKRRIVEAAENGELPLDDDEIVIYDPDQSDSEDSDDDVRRKKKKKKKPTAPRTEEETRRQRVLQRARSGVISENIPLVVHYREGSSYERIPRNPYAVKQPESEPKVKPEFNPGAIVSVKPEFPPLNSTARSANLRNLGVARATDEYMMQLWRDSVSESRKGRQPSPEYIEN